MPHTDIAAAAAAMRWAAARVNIAPLALPSPEHELTDPFRNARAVVPSHYPSDTGVALPFSPGLSGFPPARKHRLGSFWEGTTDIHAGPDVLSTIQGSPTTPEHAPLPPESALDHPSPSSSTSSSTTDLSGPPPPPPATVPIPTMPPELEAERTADYFNGPHNSPPVTRAISVEPLPPVPHRQNTAPELDSHAGVQTVPAIPRRVNLTRQTSSPLPNSHAMEAALGAPRAAQAEIKASRAVKEESMFLELGYLAPPYPPDELERRRALSQFNIWHTGPDANFDRIEHLTRLVFSTKTVLIGLIDGNEQWYKSASGTSANTCSRTSSICAHTILQRGDEPTVILDTHEDWRFAKSPLVTGAPHVRFYAGAPLRTQDGFNVGTLAIMDDVPRQEFSPRQRHTLKEFAAIAMREMELWRDKIQLRIRDRIQTSMEQFTRECLEIDIEAGHDRPAEMNTFSMDKVYGRAAKLVQKTLDVEGAIVMDVSHGEVVETMSAEAIVSVIVHSADAETGTVTQKLTPEESAKLYETFMKYPDGRIFEGVVPAPLRPFIPSGIQYALSVPIFNIDKRPFAMLCAYNSSEHRKRFLEGHELSYLRAIGVIILSAVLKRRMTLADKAKSLFISNISHELRTPLHGILAAAELLADTPLNHSQISFLQTVQACGTSLVETVNHVLDFTKLSGNSKSGGVEHAIGASKVDLMQLVEEAVEGCWIGHRARTSALNESEIGSFYSPPRQDKLGKVKKHVEIIVEIGERKEGWMLKFEKGGIRRVLMNVFGNSLKFTADGYVHVILRQLPSTPDMLANEVKVELSVVDTGKGISQDFLKNQLFHPFSQENPLQTGTGLGLAIVNSIVQSKGVDGKVDVWSEENVGTEIKVTFNAEVAEEDDVAAHVMEPPLPAHERYAVALVGFEDPHRGIQLLRRIVVHYVESWWGCQVAPSGMPGELAIINEDLSPVLSAIERKDPQRPFIILTASRGDDHLMSTVNEFEKIGGFCRVLYKPGGPSRLRGMLRLCLHALKMSRHSTPQLVPLDDASPAIASPPADSPYTSRVPTPGAVTRRYSEEQSHAAGAEHGRRPPMAPRSITVHPGGSWKDLPVAVEDEMEMAGSGRVRALSNSAQSLSPTIAVGSGGTLLKSSVGTLESKKTVRVLVVEDNNILRNLLVRWLSSKGYEFRDAVDGREGVRLYESDGQFDVILLDLSMPVLDGVGATMEIRQIESSRSDVNPTRILALTGMSSLEDKRRAFEAGVDGYLVKPIAFKTLTEMFSRLGIS
ncbi:hypothetical protein OF83DRAFT_1127068 [Amylostereum chailletii]|nr:hypothetical protein OF83DRAFT_1127068 [Amylostereum chailletii]